MALVTQTTNGVDTSLGCNYVDAHYSVTAFLDSMSWGRSTSNAAHSKLSFTANANLHYDTLVWSGTGDFSNNQIWCWTDLETRTTGNRTFPKGGSYCTGAVGCCYCLCSGADWYWNAYYGHFTGTVLGDVNTTQVGISAQYLGVHSGNGFYNLPDNLRVLPPVGLSVSWPSAITGSASATISKWSNNSNIGGTPTSYPGASYWTFAIDLLDENGNYLAHKTFNTNETKTCNFGSLNSGWYTASALSGTSGAIGSSYSLQAGKKYKFRAIAQNNMNQRIEVTSGVYVSSPPKPTISVTSVVYDPSTKKSKMCFTWSLSASGLTPEKLTYKVATPAGTSVASGAIKTISNGAADSGTVCNVVVPTGEKLTLTVTNTAGSTGNTMTSSAVTTVYSPVANAAFLGFDWDDVRRTCTIRAEAPGAANCRIQAGYAPNSYTVGDKLTSGQVGTLVVKDLNHGSGQILYLQATPESSDGHQYLNEIAKISVPIPNPILGLVTPSCEDIERGVEKRYIVDFVEHKTDNTCTPRWQNGDRIVKKGVCPPTTQPCITDVKCVEEHNFPYGVKSTFEGGGKTGYRIYEVTFAPGWNNKMLVFQPVNHLDNAWITDLSWISPNRIKITVGEMRNGGGTLYDESKFFDTAGNLQIMWNLQSYKNGKDQWAILQNPTLSNSICITSVTS